MLRRYKYLQGGDRIIGNSSATLRADGYHGPIKNEICRANKDSNYLLGVFSGKNCNDVKFDRPAEAEYGCYQYTNDGFFDYHNCAHRTVWSDELQKQVPSQDTTCIQGKMCNYR